MQYEFMLDGRAATDMARAIVARRCLTDGAQSYLEAIDAAITQNGSVCVAPTPHTDNTLRPFLHALAGELRNPFPWGPPFTQELKLDNWGQLFNVGQPIARIEMRLLEVSQRLGFEFGEIPGRPEPALLIRLRSGTVVGLMARPRIGDPGVEIFANGAVDVPRVLSEISGIMALHPNQIAVLQQPVARNQIPSEERKAQQRGLLPDLEPLASGVERWSPERLARHRVVIDEDGRFRTIDGGVLDTRMASASWRPNTELALFVMDPHGNLYVSLRRVVSRIHHSTLAGGGPVAAAGELRVRDGQLLTLTDHSGHYPPTRSDNQIIVAELQQRGVNIANVLFDFAAKE
ncbi:hypothetical protein FZI97_13125 [Mycobacterium sp. CBMA360]|uniref:hypothetical protein n=2 Tax=Mycolicibacterium TaxID=1866885 RepID=UPI0012DFBD47|nr:hypothetical protein [Mycolicibacterium sp. CBMA 213]MUL46843.1 hypothetical protein [Mycolicibacterium sp. CBMA 360]MUL57372.1 hypothetical protein [Mycolicibacterium sp. CBMA 335]MUL70412.1 hypothetical protein [Mycolicibacterium sp. CBMA 311]